MTLPDVIGEQSFFELHRPAPAGKLDLTPLRSELAKGLAEHAPQAARVAVAVGSRGIARIDEVVDIVVSSVKAAGRKAVIVPAMGSHGGGTPSGQEAVLRELGIDPAKLGARVDASMDVIRIGELPEGQPVFLATSVLACDAVIPVCRVKPHTDFRGLIESGLTKMLSIGLGKQVGASSLHTAGVEQFHELLPAAARVVLARLAVPFGVALIEDEWHRLRRVEVVPGSDILEREPELLVEAWAHFGRLPFAEIDILVLREMGKTVSGAGMDPNVTGRPIGVQFPVPTQVRRLAVLDLREDSGGNALGVGVADVVTERLRRKIDWVPTRANALTSKSPAGARLPLVASTDLEALQFAGAMLTGRGPGEARVVAAANTLDVTDLAVTEGLVPEAEKAGYVVKGGPCRPEISPSGTLLRIGGLDFFPGDDHPAPEAEAADRDLYQD
ncbi:MAG TPA: DUF362 domain-containing protein [Acidimicrobiales bacterium]|nr:DUF362 domain-containing protein [Acidimicrobiales bacterium]